MSKLIPIETIVSKIIIVSGEKVLLDSDLAELYGVETFNLNKAVKRNIDRFPKDFMFQLSKKEWDVLKFHFGISSSHGGRRTLPFVFSEQGVAMLSSVLQSKRAVEVNIAIMRTFVKMRKLLSSHKELRIKIEAMEKKYDKNFRIVFSAIKELMEPSGKDNKKKIGFRID